MSDLYALMTMSLLSLWEHGRGLFWSLPLIDWTSNIE